MVMAGRWWKMLDGKLVNLVVECYEPSVNETTEWRTFKHFDEIVFGEGRGFSKWDG